MKVIFNADDYGITEPVSETICDLLEKSGILKSTTVMANLMSERSAELIKSLISRHGKDKYSFGLHFNLTCGRPALPPQKVSTLINPKTSEFLKFNELVTAIIQKKADPAEIKAEFKAQIGLFYEKLGFYPSHIDSHKHMHCMPEILKIAAGSIGRFKINRLRLPANISGHELFSSQGIDKELITNHFKENTPAQSQRSCANVCPEHFDLPAMLRSFGGEALKYPDGFMGTYTVGKLSAVTFKDEISRCAAFKTGEYMVHPGACDETLKKLSSLLMPRESERDALMDAGLKSAIDESGIEPVSFFNL